MPISSGSEIQGLVAWFDAADSSTVKLDSNEAVSGWLDKTGSSRHLLIHTEPSGGGTHPSYTATRGTYGTGKVIKRLPVVGVSGYSFYAKDPLFQDDQNWSVVGVFCPTIDYYNPSPIGQNDFNNDAYRLESIPASYAGGFINPKLSPHGSPSANQFYKYQDPRPEVGTIYYNWKGRSRPTSQQSDIYLYAGDVATIVCSGHINLNVSGVLNQTGPSKSELGHFETVPSVRLSPNGFTDGTPMEYSGLAVYSGQLLARVGDEIFPLNSGLNTISPYSNNGYIKYFVADPVPYQDSQSYTGSNNRGPVNSRHDVYRKTVTYGRLNFPDSSNFGTSGNFQATIHKVDRGGSLSDNFGGIISTSGAGGNGSFEFGGSGSHYGIYYYPTTPADTFTRKDTLFPFSQQRAVILSMVCSENEFKVYMNGDIYLKIDNCSDGTNTGFRDIRSAFQSGLYIGASYNAHHIVNSEHAEWLFYDHDLAPLDRIQLENHLSDKWNISFFRDPIQLDVMSSGYLRQNQEVFVPVADLYQSDDGCGIFKHVITGDTKQLFEIKDNKLFLTRVPPIGTHSVTVYLSGVGSGLTTKSSSYSLTAAQYDRSGCLEPFTPPTIKDENCTEPTVSCFRYNEKAEECEEFFIDPCTVPNFPDLKSNVCGYFNLAASCEEASGAFINVSGVYGDVYGYSPDIEYWVKVNDDIFARHEHMINLEGWSQDIAMNASGDVLAMSSLLSTTGQSRLVSSDALTLRDTRTDDGQGGSGVIRVYRKQGTAWSRFGPDISGSPTQHGQLFGSGLATNANGHRLVATSLSGVTAFGYNTQTDQWDQLGNTIIESGYNNSHGYIRPSVDMNASGHRIVIGQPYYNIDTGENWEYIDENSNARNGRWVGKACVYQYDISSNSWGKIGSNIFGSNRDLGTSVSGNMQFGYEVTINASGDRIGVSALNDGRSNVGTLLTTVAPTTTTTTTTTTVAPATAPSLPLQTSNSCDNLLCIAFVDENTSSPASEWNAQFDLMKTAFPNRILMVIDVSPLADSIDWDTNSYYANQVALGSNQRLFSLYKELGERLQRNRTADNINEVTSVWSYINTIINSKTQDIQNLFAQVTEAAIFIDDTMATPVEQSYNTIRYYVENLLTDLAANNITAVTSIHNSEENFVCPFTTNDCCPSVIDDASRFNAFNSLISSCASSNAYPLGTPAVCTTTTTTTTTTAAPPATNKIEISFPTDTLVNYDITNTVDWSALSNRGIPRAGISGLHKGRLVLEYSFNNGLSWDELNQIVPDWTSTSIDPQQLGLHTVGANWLTELLETIYDENNRSFTTNWSSILTGQLRFDSSLNDDLRTQIRYAPLEPDTGDNLDWFSKGTSSDRARAEFLYHAMFRFKLLILENNNNNGLVQSWTVANPSQDDGVHRGITENEIDHPYVGDTALYDNRRESTSENINRRIYLGGPIESKYYSDAFTMFNNRLVPTNQTGTVNPYNISSSTEHDASLVYQRSELDGMLSFNVNSQAVSSDDNFAILRRFLDKFKINFRLNPDPDNGISHDEAMQRLSDGNSLLESHLIPDSVQIKMSPRNTGFNFSRQDFDPILSYEATTNSEGNTEYRLRNTANLLTYNFQNFSYIHYSGSQDKGLYRMYFAMKLSDFYKVLEGELDLGNSPMQQHVARWSSSGSSYTRILQDSYITFTVDIDYNKLQFSGSNAGFSFVPLEDGAINLSIQVTDSEVDYDEMVLTRSINPVARISQFQMNNIMSSHDTSANDNINTGFDISEDGCVILALTGQKKTLLLKYNSSTNEYEKFYEHSGDSRAVLASTGMTFAASNPAGHGSLQVFDFDGSWKETMAVSGNSGDDFGQNLAISADGNTVVVSRKRSGSVSSAPSINIWKRNSSGIFSKSKEGGIRGHYINILIDNYFGNGAKLALNKDGTVLVALDYTGMIHVYHLLPTNEEDYQRQEWHLTQRFLNPTSFSSYINSIAISADGSRIVLGTPFYTSSANIISGGGGRIYIWDRLDEGAYNPNSVNDNRYSNGTSILESTRPFDGLGSNGVNTRFGMGVSISADGKRIVATDNNSTQTSPAKARHVFAFEKRGDRWYNIAVEDIRERRILIQDSLVYPNPYPPVAISDNGRFIIHDFIGGRDFANSTSLGPTWLGVSSLSYNVLEKPNCQTVEFTTTTTTTTTYAPDKFDLIIDQKLEVSQDELGIEDALITDIFPDPNPDSCMIAVSYRKSDYTTKVQLFNRRNGVLEKKGIPLSVRRGYAFGFFSNNDNYYVFSYYQGSPPYPSFDDRTFLDFYKISLSDQDEWTWVAGTNDKTYTWLPGKYTPVATQAGTATANSSDPSSTRIATVFRNEGQYVGGDQVADEIWVAGFNYEAERFYKRTSNLDVVGLFFDAAISSDGTLIALMYNNTTRRAGFSPVIDDSIIVDVYEYTDGRWLKRFAFGFGDNSVTGDGPKYYSMTSKISAVSIERDGSRVRCVAAAALEQQFEGSSNVSEFLHIIGAEEYQNDWTLFTMRPNRNGEWTTLPINDPNYDDRYGTHGVPTSVETINSRYNAGANEKPKMFIRSEKGNPAGGFTFIHSPEIHRESFEVDRSLNTQSTPTIVDFAEREHLANTITVNGLIQNFRTLNQSYRIRDSKISSDGKELYILVRNTDDNSPNSQGPFRLQVYSLDGPTDTKDCRDVLLFTEEELATTTTTTTTTTPAPRTWKQIQQNTLRDYYTQMHGDQSQDWAGWSISSSANGSVVALGMPKWGDNNRGGVKVFAWTGNYWKQMGTILEGRSGSDAVSDEEFGYNLSLSDDGKTLAVGSRRNNYVKVYRWRQSYNNWFNQFEFKDIHDIMTSRGLVTPAKPVLSGDGSVLAVAVPFERILVGNQLTGGKVNIYALKDIGSFKAGDLISSLGVGDVATDVTDYMQLTQEERENQFGISIDLNYDGTVLAVAARGRRNTVNFTDAQTIADYSQYTIRSFDYQSSPIVLPRWYSTTRPEGIPFALGDSTAALREGKVLAPEGVVHFFDLGNTGYVYRRTGDVNLRLPIDSEIELFIDLPDNYSQIYYSNETARINSRQPLENRAYRTAAEIFSGTKISLDDTGNILSVSNMFLGTNFRGVVTVYKYSQQQWDKMYHITGNDPDRRPSDISDEIYNHDLFGRSIDLSGDGRRLIVGAGKPQVIAGFNSRSRYIQVTVYQASNEMMENYKNLQSEQNYLQYVTQLGRTISQRTFDGQITSLYAIRWPVSISKNGDVLAFGNYYIQGTGSTGLKAGYGQVYALDGVTMPNGLSLLASSTTTTTTTTPQPLADNNTGLAACDSLRAAYLGARRRFTGSTEGYVYNLSNAGSTVIRGLSSGAVRVFHTSGPDADITDSTLNIATNVGHFSLVGPNDPKNVFLAGFATFSSYDNDGYNATVYKWSHQAGGMYRPKPLSVNNYVSNSTQFIEGEIIEHITGLRVNRYRVVQRNVLAYDNSRQLYFGLRTDAQKFFLLTVCDTDIVPEGYHGTWPRDLQNLPPPTTTTTTTTTTTPAPLWRDISGALTGILNTINTRFGESISISSDGSVIAIGSPMAPPYSNTSGSGYVRVFAWDGAAFVQVGSDISYGYAEKDFGFSVSLSSYGGYLAIGAPGYETGRATPGSSHVYRFDFATGEWERLLSLGDSFLGQNYLFSGHSVSISDLDYMAVGSPGYDHEPTSDTGKVSVRHFTDVNEDRNKTFVGGELSGYDVDASNENHESGSSIYLTPSARTLAVKSDGYDESRGRVTVFRYDYSSKTWSQLGPRIEGINKGDTVAAGVALSSVRDSNTSVALSDDGNIVAIGDHGADATGTVIDSGRVRIFKYAPASSTVRGSSWVQLGQTIFGENGDISGWSISLSADGKTVAIGAPFNDGGGSEAGHVRVYQYDEEDEQGTWKQVGEDIDGQVSNARLGSCVSMSSDANVVAVSQAGFGVVQVYVKGDFNLPIGTDRFGM